jgi:hypothetical protein
LADFGRGIKAGVAVAAAYLIIALILAVIGQTFWYPSDFIYAAGLGIQLEFTVPFVLASSIFGRIIQGIIFGAAFAALYDYLPGSTSVRKGVIFSAFLWIVGAVWLIYATPGWPTGSTQISAMPGVTVRLSSIGLALVSIIFSLAFGALVGAIWNKLRGKQVTEVRKGIAALLVSFILGGLMWAGGVVWFFIIVVIRGVPVPGEPGPSWWYSILYVSVVFLGLPGWILALVAWRKMRRGESGLKLGVAGGVIMALAGIMLLPGVLAIIGGVLSRRKPASEYSSAVIGQ